jgi:hypothetical protein
LTQVIAFMAEAGTIKTPLPAAKQFADLQYLHATGVQSSAAEKYSYASLR